MIGISENVLIALISAIATIAVAYIVNVLTIKYRNNKPRTEDKQKIDSAFERMGQVATRLQTENDFFREENKRLSEDNTNLRIENARLKSQRT